MEIYKFYKKKKTMTYLINNIIRIMPIALFSLIGLATANYSIYSKSYSIRCFSTVSHPNLDPNFITKFSDGFKKKSFNSFCK
jgi:hypothetical protein